MAQSMAKHKAKLQHQGKPLFAQIQESGRHEDQEYGGQDLPEFREVLLSPERN